MTCKKKLTALLLASSFLALGSCSFDVRFTGINEEAAYETATAVRPLIQNVFDEDVPQFSYRSSTQISISHWSFSSTVSLEFDYVKGEYMRFKSSLSNSKTIFVAEEAPGSEQTSISYAQSNESFSDTSLTTLFKSNGRFLLQSKNKEGETFLDYESEEEFQDAFVSLADSLGASAKQCEDKALRFYDACVSFLEEKVNASSGQANFSGGLHNYLAFRGFSSKDLESSFSFLIAGHGKLSWMDFGDSADYSGRVDVEDYRLTRSEFQVSEELTPNALVKLFGRDAAYWRERQTRRKAVSTIKTSETISYSSFTKSIPSKIPPKEMEVSASLE